MYFFFYLSTPYIIEYAKGVYHEQFWKKSFLDHFYAPAPTNWPILFDPPTIFLSNRIFIRDFFAGCEDYIYFRGAKQVEEVAAVEMITLLVPRNCDASKL